MKKKIISLFMCFCMVITMLPVITLASDTVTIRVTANKETAFSGDTVDFTVTMDAISELSCAAFSLSIPSGMTYVTNSASIPDGLKATLGMANTSWTENTLLWSCYGNTAGFTTDKTTTLLTFSCKVKDDAKEDQSVTIMSVDLYKPDNLSEIEETVIPATVAVSAKPSQTITTSDVTVTYGDTGKSIFATTTDGGTVSYTVKPGSEDYIDVDATGALTIKKAGIAYVTVTAAETVSYAETTKDVKVTINPKSITPSVDLPAEGYTYDGTAKTPSVTVKDGEITIDPTEYTVTYADNTNAGTAKAIITAKAGGNYTWEAQNKTFTINKADYTVSVAPAQQVKVGSGLKKIEVPSSIKGVNGETVSGKFKFYSDAERKTLAVDSDISDKSVGESVTLYWSFSQTNANYIGSKTGTVTVTIVAKDTQTINAPNSIELTYGDTTGKIFASLKEGNGTISYKVTEGEDVISVDSEGNITILKAGTAEITVIAAESDEYAKATKTVHVTVSKKVINKPSASPEKFVYNGKKQTYNVAANSAYDVNNNKRTNAGTQTVTVALKDTNNYIWNDNTSEDITFEFIIEKATVTITAKNIVAYIGEAKHELSSADYIVTGLAKGETFAKAPELKYEPEPDMNKVNEVKIVVSGAEVPTEDNYNKEIVYKNGSYSVRETIHISDPIIISIGSGSRIEVEENPNTGAKVPGTEMLALLAACGAAIALCGKKR